MSEAAAERSEAPAGSPAYPRVGPRFAPEWACAPAGEVARALFERTASVAQPPTGTDAGLAISLSELRRHVALQAGELERAMDEIASLTRRLEGTRARAAAAEGALARERGLRGRQASESARRLSEHEQAIARLSTELRSQREAAAAPHPARTALLERQIAARARMDERVVSVIAATREAIVEVRAELARGAERITRLESALTRERARRTTAERRLAEAPPRNGPAGGRPADGERRKPLGGVPADGGGEQPGGVSDIATACRKLEHELAARDALEIRAARLIARLNRQFAAGG